MKAMISMSLAIITTIGITLGLVTEYRNQEETIVLSGLGVVIIIVMFSMMYEKQRSEKHVN